MMMQTTLTVALSLVTLSRAEAVTRLDHLQGPDPLRLDPALDCGLRQLAYNYSLTLMPERTPLREVHDALRLGAECGFPPPSQSTPLEWPPTIVTDAAATYYADPVRGSDTGAGTIASPFKTVGRAVSAARGGPSPAAIILRNGTYYLPQPIVLTATDSGLTISAYPGELPVLSGGAPLTGLTWSRVPTGGGGGGMSPTALNQNNVGNCGINAPGASSPQCKYNGTSPDEATCRAACTANSTCTSYTWHDSSTGSYALCCYFRVDGVWAPAGESGHFSAFKYPGGPKNLWSADISGAGIATLPFDTLFSGDRRAIRARSPNGNPEITFQPQGFTSAANWHAPHPASAPEEIHVDEPKRAFDPFFPDFQWGIGGTCSNFNPPEGFWCTKSPPYGNMYNVPGGLTYGDGTFPRASNWSTLASGNSAIVHAFHDGYWGDWAFSVSAHDPVARTLEFGAGGWQEARGSGSGGVMYIENIFEEIDAPGEWVLNGTTLYFNFNDTVPDPNAGVPLFVATQLETVISISASKAAPAVGITLANLTFAHTAPTFMRPFESGGGGDWSFYRGGAVVLEGTHDVTIAGCTFWSPGGNGLIISGHNRNATVTRSHFAYAGDSAIVSAGRGAGSMDAVAGDYPAGTRILYNLVREIGLYVKQSGFYYHSLSANATIEGNVAFNMPRAGININDGFAGGHAIVKNLIFNSVRETSDHGCVNTWDRQPYVTHEFNLTDLLPSPSVIDGNYFVNNYHSTWPIDHDDGSNSWVATNNLLLWGSFKNYLGFGKTARFNLYIYPDASVSKFSPSLQPRVGSGGWPNCVGSFGTSAFPASLSDVWTDNTCVATSGKSNFYNWGGCNPADPLDGNIPALRNNTLISGDGSYAFSCGSSTWSLTDAQSRGVELGTQVVTTAPSTADLIALARAKIGM